VIPLLSAAKPLERLKFRFILLMEMDRDALRLAARTEGQLEAWP
jgi:hypothetical protein